MRILQLCCDSGIAYGGAKGASVHLGELSRAFTQEGAEVLVAVARNECRVPPPGITVQVIPPAGNGRGGKAAQDRARADWLIEVIGRWEPDLVYERLSLHCSAGVAAAAATGVPHLLEVNAPLSQEAARYRGLDEPELAKALETLTLSGTDLLLAVSRPIARYARERGAREVRVCPNAVDPSRFPVPAPVAEQPARAVFSGSLRPWHGSGTLAEAWGILGSDAPPLVIIGDGTGRESLEAAGATVTGMVHHAGVPVLLRSAHIALAPYPGDAPDYFSPLKLFEYLAAGLPVVAGDIPGVADVAGEVAILVPPGDAGALAGAVAELSGDPQRRLRLGRAGRELALGFHTWRHRARGVMQLAGEVAREVAGVR